MSMTLEQIVAETRQWPRDQLAALMDRLSVELHGGNDPAIEDAWKVETARRVVEIRSGSVPFIPAEDVLAELRKIAGR